MADSVHESWLEWFIGGVIGTQADAAPGLPKMDMLAAPDAKTSNPATSNNSYESWLFMSVPPRTPLPWTNCPRRQAHLNRTSP